MAILIGIIGTLLLLWGLVQLGRVALAPSLVNPSIGAFDELSAGDAVTLSGTIAVNAVHPPGAVIAYNLYSEATPNAGTPVHQERAAFDLQIADGTIGVQDGYEIDLSEAPTSKEAGYVYYELRAGEPVTVRGTVRPGEQRMIAAQQVALGEGMPPAIDWLALAPIGAGLILLMVAYLLGRSAMR